MKNDIDEFVAEFPNFYQVKVEHQTPSGITQEIPITLFKYGEINMDFVTGLHHYQ